MTDTVHAVVDKGEGHDGLEADLGEDRKGTESGSNRSGLEVPAQQGRNKVCRREKVHATRQDDTGDTVSATADPGDLGTVDGKVGGDRAVAALLSEDLVGVRGVGSRLPVHLSAQLVLISRRDIIQSSWAMHAVRGCIA